MNLTHLDQYFITQRDQHLQQLKAFLAIPSISALSAYEPQMREACQFLVKALEEAGLENISIQETGGHPAVYADWLHAADQPTILFYGHYDVQPVDPLELWETAPFDATIRDNKLFARGASDDKGQVFMHIKAIEAMIKETGSLPVNVKILIEGEEEIGSPNLVPFVKNYSQQLANDVIVISDTGMYAPGQPAICYGLRGLTGIQIDIQGPTGDLHSGIYGGGIQNPLHAIAALIASFHDEHGLIAVEGFYEDVRPLTPQEREAFAALPFDQKALEQEIGTPLWGEPHFTYTERTWARPTLEVNGLTGGFSGEGIKTVLPAKAQAKITCRLVPDQEPDQIISLLRAHIEKHRPEGVQVMISEFDKGLPFLTPIDHPAIQAAAAAYEAIYQVPTAYIRGGGSIPIVADFSEQLHVPVVLMGFGLDSENFHAPNEHFHLENFDKGLRVICQFYQRLSTLTKQDLQLSYD